MEAVGFGLGFRVPLFPAPGFASPLDAAAVLDSVLFYLRGRRCPSSSLPNGPTIGDPNKSTLNSRILIIRPPKLK